ncbi:MAG TPA: hypothetical protein VKD26_10500 [Streptosporangiaceae bacterium]|nr:hypothetical protein [Streptosporangiaceae bacterium]
MNAPARADEHGSTASGKAGGSAPAGGSARAGVPFLVTGLVAVLAIGVRLWPLLSNHMLGGLLEYDDGVHYDASAHLIGGVLPYRDFVFVQPPGVILLLVPFAALGRLAGDQTAMTAARFGVMLVAAVNVVLLTRLIRPRAGRVAAVAAGLTYAVWGGAAAAERTVLLEPLLGLGLLGAMTLLGAPAVTRRSPARRAGRVRAGEAAPGGYGRRLVAAGLLLGLALAVKTWAVVDIAVLAGWLAWRSGWRAAAAFAGVAFGAAAAVCAPFFAAAPGAMIHQVIADQLGRTERLTPDPLVFLHEVAGVGQVYGRAGAAAGAAIAVIALFVLAVLVALWRGPRIWAVLAIAALALTIPQRSYTYHYIDFAAPALAACAGISIAALLRAARRAPGRAGRGAAAAAGVAVTALLAVFAWQSVTHDVVGSLVQPEFTAFFAAHPCAFSDYPSLLVAADAETRQARLRCASLVDYTGAALAVGNGRMVIQLGHGAHARFYRYPTWQAEVRRVLGTTDAAVLSWRPQRWTPATDRYFHHRFRQLSRVGSFTLWVLRR